MKTKIEWATDVWNPITGCTKVSAGCKNCYAERFAHRLAGRFGYPEDDPFRVTLHMDHLRDPLHWRKHRRVFVCSMGDLFHPDVPRAWIDEVFMIMDMSPRHTFMILTKRPDRMCEYVTDLLMSRTMRMSAPLQILPNVWMNVSVENQEAADERIPWLLNTPAKVRGVSCEPLLGPVDLSWSLLYNGMHHGNVYYQKLDWVIVGGESGSGARPMHPDWARSLRDQCQGAGVPFFFKQFGRWIYDDNPTNPTWPDGTPVSPDDHPVVLRDVGKKAAGRLLDGREWNEYPGWELESPEHANCLCHMVNVK